MRRDGYAVVEGFLTDDELAAAERFCGTTALQLDKIELWAKYSGGSDDDQAHHRDYGNHSLVVPRTAG